MLAELVAYAVSPMLAVDAAGPAGTRICAARRSLGTYGERGGTCEDSAACGLISTGMRRSVPA